MLELDEGQLSRPVLRGRGGSNTSLLPGLSVSGSSQRARVCAGPDPLVWRGEWGVEREAGEQWPGGRWGPTRFPGCQRLGGPSALSDCERVHAIKKRPPSGDTRKSPAILS